MLGHNDSQLREMAAFALGRLAQNPDNQAGVVACGGLLPLIDLLESRQGNLQVCEVWPGWTAFEHVRDPHILLFHFNKKHDKTTKNTS